MYVSWIRSMQKICCLKAKYLLVSKTSNCSTIDLLRSTRIPLLTLLRCISPKPKSVCEEDRPSSHSQ